MSRAEDRLDFAPGAPIRGDLNVSWIHGSPSPWHRTDPPIQVHAYDPNTYILRESKDVSFEAPFLYLLFGNERALLVDTGATADPGRFPLRPTVDRLIEDWLGQHPRTEYGLVVAHSHSHGDHTAGDAQFTDRPRTRIVERTPESVRQFFALPDRPDAVVPFDLGGRRLEVMAIPGHHPASIAVYDPWTGLLLTGDTVCPGRLYVFDMPAFLGSLDQLVRFAGSRPIRHVMGAHVEMTRVPTRDYPVGARYQPAERPIEMPPERLLAIRSAANSVAHHPGAYAFDDFMVFHFPCSGAMARQLARGTLWNLRHRLGLL